MLRFELEKFLSLMCFASLNRPENDAAMAYEYGYLIDYAFNVRTYKATHRIVQYDVYWTSRARCIQVGYCCSIYIRSNIPNL
jgi:hypothetical protein